MIPYLFCLVLCTIHQTIGLFIPQHLFCIELVHSNPMSELMLPKNEFPNTFLFSKNGCPQACRLGSHIGFNIFSKTVSKVVLACFPECSFSIPVLPCHVCFTSNTWLIVLPVIFSTFCLVNDCLMFALPPQASSSRNKTTCPPKDQRLQDIFSCRLPPVFQKRREKAVCNQKQGMRSVPQICQNLKTIFPPPHPNFFYV